MNATPTSPTIEPHEPHWVSRAAFPVVMALFFLTQVSLGFAVYCEFYWLAVPLVLVSSHLMHGILIAFHEASHGLLRKNRLLNEIDGILIGTFGLMSFSLTARRINRTTPTSPPSVTKSSGRSSIRGCRARARPGRDSRTGVGTAFHAVPVHPRPSSAGIDDSEQEPAPAHLGGVPARRSSGLSF